MKASLMIFPNDFNSLVNYFSFCMWLFHTATCFTVIIFRYTRPVAQFPRLFKVSHRFDSINLFLSQVPLILPVVICVIGCYLIAVPFLQVSFDRKFLRHKLSHSKEFDLGYLFAVCWIAFGYILRVTITKATCLNGPLSSFTQLVQRVFQVVPEGVEVE